MHPWLFIIPNIITIAGFIASPTPLASLTPSEIGLHHLPSFKASLILDTVMDPDFVASSVANTVTFWGLSESPTPSLYQVYNIPGFTAPQHHHCPVSCSIPNTVIVLGYAAFLTPSTSRVTQHP